MKYDHNEDEVAQRLGVPRETIRRIRTENGFGAEEYGMARRQIRYSQKGIEKIINILAMSNAQEAKSILGSITQVPPEAAPDLPAVVKRVFLKNGRFMEATLNGEEIIIRVRNNQNFLPGMQIERAQLQQPPGGNMWDFVGRLPRGRGRW
ncbi:MAG: hypothetical protein PHX05_00190 [Acidobacteriota bacterium]|nr:hypothetical protein [Acidobacteriota bacterium]